MLSQAFTPPELMAEITVKMLLEIEAVHFRADEPYTFTSGLKSPVYIDCRKLISYPRIRQTLMGFAASMVLKEAGFERFDAVAGGETAGIPFAAWLADRLALPMLYVRKQPKGFGRDAQIEGHLEEGQRVLLVEDLTTDGGSKIKFADALRKAGAVVTDTVVVFYYDIFPETRTKLAEKGLRLHALATWWNVLEVARATGHFDEPALTAAEAFLREPLRWSKDHGGISEMSI
jgi:orotate phosphoribosyltransferase